MSDACARVSYTRDARTRASLRRSARTRVSRTPNACTPVLARRPRLALACLAFLVGGLAGCAATSGPARARAPFTLPADGLAYENETTWDYRISPDGRLLTWTPREPPPDVALRCGVMARAVRQFWVHAVFEPNAPRPSRVEAERLAAEVLARDRRRKTPSPDPVVIPGYPDLWSFSADHAAFLQAAVGGSWQTYVQRGNWRMIFPFSEKDQQATAETLLAEVRGGQPALVHVLRFPKLMLNHVVLFYGASETPDAIRFAAYDPNQAGTPIEVSYDRGARTFSFPRTEYFPGGPIRLYEIYDGALY